RGQSSSSNNIDIDDDDDNGYGDESSPPRREGSGNDGLRRRLDDGDTDRNNSNIRDGNSNGFIGGGALVGGPSCNGNGATAAVGVGIQSGPAFGTAIYNALGLGSSGGPSHQFTTPYKPPMKGADSGAGLLVAATPSSITTAGETAESTYLSNSPINVRRRRDRSSSNINAAPSLHRQYQLLRSQIILLLGSSGLGLILFLFYALPLVAFLSLVLMVSSMGALLPVAISFVRARYEMEMEHPLGLVRYLPDSLRVFLTETTLHEFMADTTLFMETRYLLMYFIPGLSPEQLMEYIHRLPPRHREALLQPGLGRLMPSVMESLMRIDNTNNVRGQYDLDNLETLLVGSHGDDAASSASGLTIERERQGEDGGDAEVTFFEAVTKDDDNSSFNFSVDLSAHGLTNMLARQGVNDAPSTPAVVAAAATSISDLRNVMVELPHPSNLDFNNGDQEAIRLQEYDLEGRILSEAASAAVATYTSQASVAVRVAASDAIASSSSWIIRAGLFTGVIAGGGGIMATIFSTNSAVARSSSDGVGRGNSNGSDTLPERRSGYALTLYGLFTTSALGFAGAGIAYLVRNRARAVIAANRDVKSVETAPEKESERRDP
ncbi:hypothetical protein ACHAXH_001290, partial [Discostella pseudostelligera]